MANLLHISKIRKHDDLLFAKSPNGFSPNVYVVTLHRLFFASARRLIERQRKEPTPQNRIPHTLVQSLPRFHTRAKQTHATPEQAQTSSSRPSTSCSLPLPLRQPSRPNQAANSRRLRSDPQSHPPKHSSDPKVRQQVRTRLPKAPPDYR